MDPVMVHFIADWCLQSQWMASDKTSRWRPAAAHVAVYGLIFWLIVRPSAAALALIVGTHYLIDRYRLARHVNWAANFLAPVEPTPAYADGNPRIKRRYRWRSVNPPWSECSKYGSPPGTPDHIGFMVMVTVDQIMHIVINYAALRWLS